MNVMKPILFNTEMVKAIKDGRKTVTRRIIKPKYTNTEIILKNGKAFKTLGMPATTVEINLPYQCGDILYVRETWYYEKSWHDITAGKPDLPSGRYSHRYVYRADNPNYLVDVGVGINGWKPSIHMPKEAARIFLRITTVRVERLQDMTLDDLLAEGIVLRPEASNYPDNAYLQAKKEYSRVWNSTIKKSDLNKYGWTANPLVTVNEFRRISKEEALNASI